MELLNLVPRPPAVGHNLLDSIARSILSFGLGQIFQRAAPLGNTAVEGMADSFSPLRRLAVGQVEGGLKDDVIGEVVLPLTRQQ